jgi:glycosyltransferase involved in cell wall biosynthesis
MHTLRWARSLSEKDYKIIIFGLGILHMDEYSKIQDVQVITFGEIVDAQGKNNSFRKYRYLKAVPSVRKIIKHFKPDIVHAHFASSYGLLGALSGFHPFILSAWGTDIFDFPKISLVNKGILKYNLWRADRLLSTSRVMKNEMQQYTGKEIIVTPFGVDIEIFTPMIESKKHETRKKIVIGTIKSLEKRYGIDYLIKAFKIVCDRHEEMYLELLIAGGGSMEKTLKALAQKEGVWDKTIFAGKITPDEVPKYHNKMTVTVFLSNSESFGVSTLEASACEKPVVVSNVGGLPEVVIDSKTGIIVKKGDILAAADAIEKLILSESLRRDMGIKGRKMVSDSFSWEDNVNQMIAIYKDVLE